jgi:hypothetical protein
VNSRPAIVTAALRVDGVVFSATDKVTVPGPVPVDSPEIEIHEMDEEAVQLHSAPDDMPTLTLPAAGPTDTELPESVVLQLTPACDTVKFRLPIAIVPERLVGLVFGATEYWMVPFPFPEAPDVIVSHAALLEAFHAHPAVVDTATDAFVPADASETEFGVRPIVQGMPACVISTV